MITSPWIFWPFLKIICLKAPTIRISLINIMPYYLKTSLNEIFQVQKDFPNLGILEFAGKKNPSVTHTTHIGQHCKRNKQPESNTFIWLSLRRCPHYAALSMSLGLGEGRMAPLEKNERKMMVWKQLPPAPPPTLQLLRLCPFSLPSPWPRSLSFSPPQLEPSLSPRAHCSVGSEPFPPLEGRGEVSPGLWGRRSRNEGH